jgi:chemotaxis protein CheD
MGVSRSVGLGEYVVSRNAEDVLVAFGLGSCIAVSLVDPVSRVSGLVHTVLPERANGTDAVPAKYVDSGIEVLLNEMIKAGADRRRLVICMAGGANMLISSALSNAFDIGTRNIQSARQTLQRLNLRLHNEQVGGHTGRTMRVYVQDGRTTVRVVGGKEEELSAIGAQGCQRF